MDAFNIVTIAIAIVDKLIQWYVLTRAKSWFLEGNTDASVCIYNMHDYLFVIPILPLKHVKLTFSFIGVGRMSIIREKSETKQKK